ncbi:MAG: lysylphosphatidylglycerol synthase transmembrane domain-containing protein [Pseudomonadota bacterium]
MKRHLLVMVKLVVSIGLMVALFWVADPAAVWGHLRSADAGWLTVAAGTLLSVTVLMAWRWQLVAQSLGLDIPLPRAVQEFFLSNLVNQILPGGMVGDVARAVRVRDAGDLKKAAWSVALDRVFGQVILFSLMATGFAVALAIPGGIPWPSWAWGVIGALFCIALVSITVRWWPVTHVVGLLRNPFQVVLSCTIAALLVSGFWACAQAVGAPLSHGALFTLIPLVLSAMLIPLSIGGWGWREGAAAALFPLAGFDASTGVAAGVAYGSLLLLTATPAVVLYLAQPVAERGTE